jgi:hypothetical protein
MLLRRSLVCREGAVLQSLMEFTSPVRLTRRWDLKGSGATSLLEPRLDVSGNRARCATPSTLQHYARSESLLAWPVSLAPTTSFLHEVRRGLSTPTCFNLRILKTTIGDNIVLSQDVACEVFSQKNTLVGMVRCRRVIPWNSYTFRCSKEARPYRRNGDGPRRREACDLLVGDPNRISLVNNLPGDWQSKA